MSARGKVSVYRGDTWKRSWTFKDAQQALIPLTGATARLFVRDSQGAVVITASSQNGELVIRGTEGTIVMTVPASAMALAPGRYEFDLEVTFADGTVATYDRSTLTVLEDVTHG